MLHLLSLQFVVLKSNYEKQTTLQDCETIMKVLCYEFEKREYVMFADRETLVFFLCRSKQILYVNSAVKMT